MESGKQRIERSSTPQKRGFAEREVTRRLIQAIFEQRLPPGARITEEQLAEAFNVSRTVVRQSMNRLSEMGLFKKTPNQGCTIAAPTRQEARMMLEVRALIEPAIAQRATSSASRRTSNSCARISGRKRRRVSRRIGSTLVRLTGEFHLLIAEMTGNPYLVRIMTELQVLTCLAILVHAESETGCPRDEHSVIVAAIAQRDGNLAAAEMTNHLRHIANELQLDRKGPERSLERAFRWLSENGVAKDQTCK